MGYFFRQRWSGEHQVRGLREAGVAQRVLLLRHLQGLHGGQGLHTGRRQHHLPGVCQEEDHGGDGGEERVGGKEERPHAEQRVRRGGTMIVGFEMKSRGGCSKRWSLGCVLGSSNLGVALSSSFGGPAV